MTGAYDWNSMPHRVSITCPACRSLANFEFAEVVRIKLRADVPYFQESDAFEYQLFEDSCGSRWHGAIFYHGLRESPSAAIRDLPEGYSPEDWDHSRYLYRSHGLDIGSVVCGSCDYRRKHALKWPDDAYFQIEYRRRVLWAFDRETAFELHTFIASDDRCRAASKWQAFLRHVPSHFLKQQARDTVTKKLKKLLHGTRVSMD